MAANRDKLIYKGKVISLSLKSVILPDGRRSIVEVIDHPGAVLVAPLRDNGSCVLIRQFRPAIRKYIYEFPAGTRRPGEAYSACAKRELKEETGLISRDLKRLGEIYPVPGYATEKIVIYKAGKLKEGECRREDDEFMETVHLSRAQIVSLFRRGDIVDAKTICALAFLGVV